MTLFPSKLGGLGCDRVLLCCDRDLSTLCRDKNSVSQQGLGLGQAWVEIRVSLCRDRVFPRVGHSCSEIRFYVAIGFSKGGVATGCFSIVTHRASLCARQNAEGAHDKPRHALCAQCARPCVLCMCDSAQ